MEWLKHIFKKKLPFYYRSFRVVAGIFCRRKLEVFLILSKKGTFAKNIIPPKKKTSFLSNILVVVSSRLQSHSHQQNQIRKSITVSLSETYFNRVTLVKQI